MNHSPIVVFCYRRLDTLQNCIAALLACEEAAHSNLIVISDAPATEAVAESVANVRAYLKQIVGFKSVEIIERPHNMGVDFNIIQGLQELAERFEKFIIVEDDIIVKKNFLQFINQSLAFYESNPQVFCVSGFSFIKYIPKDYQYHGYFTGRSNPWGWGVWSNRIKNIDWEIKDKDQFLQSNEIKKAFNYWGSDMSNMLQNTLQNKIRAWDIRMDYHIFKENLYTFYPTYSCTENIGFGRDDASNTFGYNRYKTNFNSLEISKYHFPETVFLEKKIVSQFKFKNTVLLRGITKAMKLINYNN
jgi:hypothetical protein